MIIEFFIGVYFKDNQHSMLNFFNKYFSDHIKKRIEKISSEYIII